LASLLPFSLIVLSLSKDAPEGAGLDVSKGVSESTELARGIASTRDNQPSMFNIVLVEPEIPPNTGNVIRLAANTGCRLHLIEPLGFSMDDRQLRRAGLDYHEYAPVIRHAGWQAYLDAEQPPADRMFAMTTHGQCSLYDVRFQPGDWLVFGSETRGLADKLRNAFAPAQRLKLPMQPGQRSLNLSNTVAITVFEAWRQNGFALKAADNP
jgi:tRNA (cytidine/uridine-2'-O-)-methyltransferase